VCSIKKKELSYKYSIQKYNSSISAIQIELLTRIVLVVSVAKTTD
jgi:hypothetical protein